ncbi:hypothetical protein [Pontimicrobium sp. SW4]|uniref:Tetratricopeptide repeat protein n=1 Tax=Pontimicrobium sp. SW4 TaxID=3153519 RepID=A0AAU7BTP9_9FLAO
MNNINDIVLDLTTEEQQRFITYLEKKNKRNDSKNIQLFKLLVKNEFSSKEICFKLYNINKLNAYHALRKRLYRSLIDYVANTNLEEENSIDMQIIKYILASRTFLQQGQYRVAYNILNKAENLASEHYLFALLSEIYHTQIQYSYSYKELNIDDLISKFQENEKNHHLENQLNIVYAKIRQILNEISFQGEVIDFQSILNNTLKEHNIDINESLSFKSLYQLMSIFSISAFVTNDYLNIEPFLLNTYRPILLHKHKHKQLYYHIHVVYIIANTLFRNKKFSKSIDFLQQMHLLMQEKKGKHYNNFKLKYNLLLALNLNYSNKQKLAIKTLESIVNENHSDIESLLNINLSLITFYFQVDDFKKAHGILSKLYHTDLWYTKKAGIEWVIKKNLIEILLHIELNNIELVESRIASFKRSHFKYLKSIKQDRAITYLLLVESYYKNPEIISGYAFKEKIKSSFEWIKPEQEDIFVMSFYSWLKSKIDNKKLYPTTLNIISLSHSVNT